MLYLFSLIAALAGFAGALASASPAIGPDASAASISFWCSCRHVILLHSVLFARFSKNSSSASDKSHPVHGAGCPASSRRTSWAP